MFYFCIFPKSIIFFEIFLKLSIFFFAKKISFAYVSFYKCVKYFPILNLIRMYNTSNMYSLLISLKQIQPWDKITAKKKHCQC